MTGLIALDDHLIDVVENIDFLHLLLLVPLEPPYEVTSGNYNYHSDTQAVQKVLANNNKRKSKYYISFSLFGTLICSPIARFFFLASLIGSFHPKQFIALHLMLTCR